VQARAKELAAGLLHRAGKGVALLPLEIQTTPSGFRYRHVEVDIDAQRRLATLTVHGPEGKQPRTDAEYEKAGASTWALQCFRELDDAILQLRFCYDEIGLFLLKTRGDRRALLQVEQDLMQHRSHWFCHEILLQMARTLRRFELTARSMFAIGDARSCLAGSFLELAFACDRIYLLDDEAVQVAVGPLSSGALPMSSGLTRLQNRFLGNPDRAATLAREQPVLSATEAEEQGLCTVLLDPIDWDDDVRIAIEERASLSPDALTGMEASLRFGGAESCDSKIFGRLSAWQNWIFTRPNATGEEGALTRYGAPESARFDWRRT
jgi:benzoyl-CoA-dihydrodiol lyase